MEEQQSLRPTWYDTAAHVGYGSSPAGLPPPMGLGIPAWAESLPEQERELTVGYYRHECYIT